MIKVDENFISTRKKCTSGSAEYYSHKVDDDYFDSHSRPVIFSLDGEITIDEAADLVEKEMDAYYKCQKTAGPVVGRLVALVDVYEARWVDLSIHK